VSICIFTEGGTEYGYGHISRCCALYDEFVKRGNTCVLYVAGDARLSGEYVWKSVEWRDISVLQGLRLSGLFAVADSYRAGLEIYEYIAKASAGVLFFDDEMRLDYPAPCTILNASFFAEKMPYPKHKDINYLFGERFTVLRSAFNPCNFEKHKREGVLITMGGSDTANITPGLLQALRKKKPELPVKIVAGQGYRNEHLIIKDNFIEIIKNASAEKIRDSMLSCEVAFTAGGQTAYELLATKTPMFVFVVAENQAEGIKAFIDFGVIKRVYFPNDIQRAVDDYLSESLSEVPSLIDGKGAERVCREVEKTWVHS